MAGKVTPQRISSRTSWCSTGHQGDLGEILDRLVGRFEVIAARSGLTITSHVAGALPPASIDPGRMEQVFANLLGNAVKFTPRGGSIALRSRIEAEP